MDSRLRVREETRGVILRTGDYGRRGVAVV